MGARAGRLPTSQAHSRSMYRSGSLSRSDWAKSHRYGAGGLFVSLSADCRSSRWQVDTDQQVRQNAHEPIALTH